MHKKLAILAACLLVVLGVSVLAMGAQSDKATYVGSERCQMCHSDKHDGWSKTTHGQFMVDVQANPDKLPGNFGEGWPKVLGFNKSDIQYVLLSKPGMLKTAEFVGKKGSFGAPADDYPVLGASWEFDKSEWVIEASASYPGGSPWLMTCAGCHTTGLQVPTKANPATVKSFAGPGIACESCHGPGSEHVVGPSKSNITVTTSAENCGQCHVRGASVAQQPNGKTFGYPYGYRPGQNLTDFYKPSNIKDNPNDWWKNGVAKNSHHMQLPEWLTTKHASALADLKTNSHANDSCLECHSADYILAPANAKPTLATAKDSITCQVCHDSHSPNPGLLRKDANQLCMDCHTGEDMKVGQAIHHPTKEMFLGENGVVPVKTMPSFHEKAGVGCTGCHMPAVTDNPNKKTHTWKVVLPKETKELGVPNSCSACHPAASLDLLQSKIDGWQAEISASLDKTKARLDQLKAKNEKKQAYQEALYNYNYVIADGTKGVHNIDFARMLLSEANKKLDTLKK